MRGADALLQPLTAGAMQLANRIWMAPLTRLRSIEPGDVPGPLASTYYRQRASAGLIVSEAAHISPQAKGYAGAPGIFSPEQVKAWQGVTEAVHAAGGRIVLQLWHVGRVSHCEVQPGGLAPVAPSALPSQGRTSLRDAEGRPVRAACSVPRALERVELPGIVDAYAMATRRARQAGFDGVEIHAAHGYLLQQFLCSGSNQRTDDYGGVIENRARLCLEAVDACCAEWSSGHVGIRIFPFPPMPDLTDDDPQGNAFYLVEQLAQRHLAYLHVSEPDWVGGAELPEAFREGLRARYPGVIVGSGAYTVEDAVVRLERGWIDAVAFGRAFIANPDLPARIRHDRLWATPDSGTFYGGGAAGYTDYPVMGD
ncbi:N-ethylmaleimide reductase [Inhella gelatinilytica]|uniref:N-ethylmaleimide reductase n=1 Tax=Inhella gelatinilytica TaxID=2795030 RepID=A0A931NDZ7_9BURK|nr:N-ethylmaleimide reductase [Inhella gelatinilytica]MBH9553159.1 N-ethylmaleimide reductase [Inhella gelatinilytica]